MLYRLVRALLFRLDPESIHHTTMGLVRRALLLPGIRRLVARASRVSSPALSQTIWGLTFPNPVGLAAGFDKNALYINEIASMGFGFVEIGTITGQAQPGNPRPRLFRLPDDRALLNRMGFNNDGSEAVSRRLAGYGEIRPVLGVNIGKSKVVPNEQALDDYLVSLERLLPHADYIVVNVSSPNTPGLRALQHKEPLAALMQGVQARNRELSAALGRAPRPVLLKIAPDVTAEMLDDILDVIERVGVDGIIATNTTTSRQGLATPGALELGAGGVSGAPVKRLALDTIRAIAARTQGRMPIIGVGGIFTGRDALDAIEAGAHLVQVWTGFVYEGPRIARRINHFLLQECARRGVEHISMLRDSARSGHDA